MTEDRSNPEDPSASFPPPHDPDREQSPDWEQSRPPDAPPKTASSMGGQSAVAVEMARMWVKEHQETAMLGAFAVGVFVGAFLRE